jgi:hypothetical protein
VNLVTGGVILDISMGCGMDCVVEKVGRGEVR